MRNNAVNLIARHMNTLTGAGTAFSVRIFVNGAIITGDPVQWDNPHLWIIHPDGPTIDNNRMWIDTEAIDAIEVIELP